MKNNNYENPQNGGNGEQPMQNPAQTNGQAYLAQPYGNVPTSPQNYNQPVEQSNFNNYAGQQAFDSCQNEWYSDSFFQRGYQSHNNFSNDSNFQVSDINSEKIAPNAFDFVETQQPYPPMVIPPNGNDPATQPYPPMTYPNYVPPRKKSGQLFNIPRAAQPKDYSDVNCDGCTPTDIDGGLDIKGRGFINIELKCLPHREKWLMQMGKLYPPKHIPEPQRLFLERLTNATQSGGFPSILFFGDHDAFDPNQVINAAEAIVLAAYYHGYWYVPQKRHTLKECVRFFWDAVLRGEGDNLDYYYSFQF